MNINKEKLVVLDNLVHFHISFLYKAFNLQNIGQHSKVISLYASNPYTRLKEAITSILATINLDLGKGNDYLDLEYWIDGKLQRQRIELIAKRSSLRKGNVFYLRCPVTGNQRRKLFLYNGKFMSRQGMGKTYYKSELQSQKQRKAGKGISMLIKHQSSFRLGNKRYFKKYYNGLPTKKYLKVLEAARDLHASW